MQSLINVAFHQGLHCLQNNTFMGFQSMCGSIRGGQRVQTREKSQKYRVFSNTGPDSLKITALPSQHSMLGHQRPAIETPFNGDLLAGRWSPAYSGIWILSSTKNKTQKLSKLDPLRQNFLDPRMQSTVCWSVQIYDVGTKTNHL